MYVPKPTKNPSGTWSVRLRINGRDELITERTKDECSRIARKRKAECLAEDRYTLQPYETPRLQDALNAYIDSKRKYCSPTTILGYERYVKNYYGKYLQQRIDLIKYQEMVDDLATKYSPKTVKSAWGLVRGMLADRGEVKKVSLPKPSQLNTTFLTIDQIKTLLDYIVGKPFEKEILLGLHSLRRSEIYGLRDGDYDSQNKMLHIHSADIIGENGREHSDTTKTAGSTRYVQIFIPRLIELLDAEGCVCSGHPNSLYKAVNKYCADCGLPLVGCHGLRRSFSSMCWKLNVPKEVTMKLGGWTDYGTVAKHYIKLDEQAKSDEVKKIMTVFCQ